MTRSCWCCNLDPFNVRESSCWVDTAALGLAGVTRFQVLEELTDSTYTWTADGNYVRLDPRKTPAHVFRVRRA